MEIQINCATYLLDPEWVHQIGVKYVIYILILFFSRLTLFSYKPHLMQNGLKFCSKFIFNHLHVSFKLIN